MDKKDIPLESVITKKIKKYLEDNDYLVFKIAGGPMQASGLPDLLAMKDGKVLFLEVKRPILGKISKLQEATIKKIKSKNIEAHIVYGVEDVKKLTEV